VHAAGVGILRRVPNTPVLAGAAGGESAPLCPWRPVLSPADQLRPAGLLVALLYAATPIAEPLEPDTPVPVVLVPETPEDESLVPTTPVPVSLQP